VTRINREGNQDTHRSRRRLAVCPLAATGFRRPSRSTSGCLASPVAIAPVRVLARRAACVLPVNRT
jgi:hypothetical protein